MRLVIADYAEHIADKLLGLATKYNVTCRDMLYDIYTLFADPAAQLNYDVNILDALKFKDPGSYYVERDNFFRQRSMLDHLPKTDIFIAINNAYPNDPLQCVEELIAIIHKAAKKAGNNTTHKAMNGIQIHSTSQAPPPLDLLAVVETFSGLMEAMNNVVTASTFSDKNASPYILSRDNAATEDPLKYINMARKFAASGATSLFKFIANFQGVTGFEKRAKKETEDVTDDSTQAPMSALEQIINADMCDLVKPDADKKIAQKELVVKKNVAENLEKSHAIVLLDVSGSMCTFDCAHGRMDRLFYAVVIVLAILDKVVSRGDVAHLILFESRPLPVRSADNPQSAADVAKWLVNRNNHGGGTDIEGALLKGFKCIKEDEKYRKCDIILITDGESYVNKATIDSSKPEKTIIRTIQVGHQGVSKEGLKNVFNFSDYVVAGGWDDLNNCPELGKVLEGV